MTVSDILEFKVECGYVVKCKVGNIGYSFYFNYKSLISNFRIYEDSSMVYLREIMFKDIV